jgi:LAGLIDADG DNA endonuclease family protein
MISSLTSIIEDLLVVVPALLTVAFVTISERKTMASMQRRLGPIKWSGNLLLWVKLSNSGNLLKLLIPNYIWKNISGWINHSCKVISQKMIEKEMEYRGSKSDFTAKFVKEQRVDGSWYSSLHNNDLKKTYLRYTLMGFERDYQVRILSNQISKLRFYTSTSASQIQKDMNLLNADFLTGFVDGESSFIILILKEPNNKIDLTVKAKFSIGLHKKDIVIL